MELKLRRLSLFLLHLYLRNKLLCLVVFYELFAITLHSIILLDFRIPCLFTLLFDKKCFGCGLSEAFEQLLNLNFLKASEVNPLIYPFIFGAVYLLYKEYVEFKYEI